MLEETGACLRNKNKAFKHFGRAIKAETTNAIPQTNRNPFNVVLPDDLLDILINCEKLNTPQKSPCQKTASIVLVNTKLRGNVKYEPVISSDSCPDFPA